MVSWEEGFLGRACPVGLIFFHVIYGKAQAAELLTGRSSSLSCYWYPLKKPLQNQPDKKEKLVPSQAIIPQLAYLTRL